MNGYFIELTLVGGNIAAFAIDSIRSIEDAGEYRILRFKNISGANSNSYPTAVAKINESYECIKQKLSKALS